MSAPDLPPRELLERQSRELAGMRSRLLRRAGVAHLGPVLDLGAGYGAVTAELARRSRGPVVALDRRPRPLAAVDAPAVCADAAALPFPPSCFDLVFAQLVFLWLPGLAAAVAEVRRVLRPGGWLVAIEPDYGGAIEHPPEIRSAGLWCEALSRAGANPRVGRELLAALRAGGFSVRAELSPGLADPGPERFDLLQGLVGERELEALRRADRLTPDEAKVVYLPHFFLSARRPA